MNHRNRRLAVLAAALVAAGLVWLVAPEVYTGTFSDLATFLRVVAWVLILGGWAVLVRRFVRDRTVATVLTATPVLVVAWLYLWPYLRPPTEVDEDFPPTAAAVAGDDRRADDPGTASEAPPPNPSSTTTSPRPTTPDTPDPTTAPPDVRAERSTSAGTGRADTAEAAPRPTARRTTAPPTTPRPTAPPTTTPPAGPVELRRAGFQGLTGHRGDGDAAVYRLEDGSVLLRFEQVDIGSGPELDVYLVPGPDQRGPGGGAYVAPLTAERGNQNYPVPGGVDLTAGTWTVLVWCETFDVEVANATLA